MSAKSYLNELSTPADRIIVAYDGMKWPEIIETAWEIGSYTGYGKTNSAHVRPGADYAVNELAAAGQLTMFDAKFHDIPPTVELSVSEATQAGASLITVHAAGGAAMLKAAVKGAEAGRSEVSDVFRQQLLEKTGLVLGITVLTSLDAADCQSIFGIDKEDPEGIQKKVIEFAHMALDAGLDGIVCSPLETKAIRADSKLDSLLVVNPGITPIFAVKAADQKRSTSAKEAMNEGADLLVIGRAINNARDYGLTKAEAAEAVGDEISEGLAA